MSFTCQQCAKEFTSKKAYKGRIPKFCSRTCYGLYIRKKRFCPVCGDHVLWCNKTFCSRSCSTIYRIGKSLSFEHRIALSIAKKGRPIKHFVENKVENAKKISDALRGKPQLHKRGVLHHYYKDGGESAIARTKEMSSLEYKNWRRAIFARDNFTCQLCNVRGVELHADHIKSYSKYPELRYEINNGRTLCKKCHFKTDTWGGKSRSAMENRNKKSERTEVLLEKSEAN